MKVRKLMHKGVETASPDTSLQILAKTMHHKDIGVVPVVAKGTVVGMLTDRDIVCRALSESLSLTEVTAGDIMSPGMITCDEEDDVIDAIKLMRKKKVRRLAVFKGRSKLTGILSLGDLTRSINAKQARKVLRAVASHHTR